MDGRFDDVVSQAFVTNTDDSAAGRKQAKADDPARVTQRETERDACTHRMADDRQPVQTQKVDHLSDLLKEKTLPALDVRVGAFGKADKIGDVDAVGLRQMRNDRAPKAAAAAQGSPVNEKDCRTFAGYLQVRLAPEDAKGNVNRHEMPSAAGSRRRAGTSARIMNRTVLPCQQRQRGLAGRINPSAKRAARSRSSMGVHVIGAGNE